MSQFTANITKGGALLDDTRQFVTLWDDGLAVECNLDRFASQNILGLPSLARAADVTRRVLRPRFVDPDAGVLAALRCLRDSGDVFVDACYYETTRDDELLALFAETAVSEWFDQGRLLVNSELVDQWLLECTSNVGVPAWTDGRRRKVARGLLAALRDFGRLAGAVGSPSKEIAGPGISDGGFAYVAYRLHQAGCSSRAMLTSTVWRRWLLDPGRIDHHMHRLAAQGLLYYDRAGSTLRIDWRATDLTEVARAVA